MQRNKVHKWQITNNSCLKTTQKKLDVEEDKLVIDNKPKYSLKQWTRTNIILLYLFAILCL